MAILGLALTMTGQQADAARGDRGPVARPHATRSAASSLGSRPAIRPASTRAGSVSTARGGHALRGAATRSSSAARASSSRDRGAVVSRGRSGRGADFADRGSRGRHGASQQHAGLGRGFHRGGFHSAMLRGTSNRFASMSACSTVRGRRVCGGSRTVAMRWSGGLAPAAGNQSSCPDGTMATLAVGHENVVRCVPM